MSIKKYSELKEFEKLFSDVKGISVQVLVDQDIAHFEIEELYQAFKERLMSELVVDNPSFQVFGKLRDL